MSKTFQKSPTNFVGAVVLLIRLTEFTLHTGTDLSANTDTIPNLDRLHFAADLDRLANDLVADTDRQRAISPAACDGMDIRATNSAGIDLNVDIVLLKFLWLELQE